MWWRELHVWDCGPLSLLILSWHSCLQLDVVKILAHTGTKTNLASDSTSNARWEYVFTILLQYWLWQYVVEWTLLFETSNARWEYDCVLSTHSLNMWPMCGQCWVDTSQQAIILAVKIMVSLLTDQGIRFGKGCLKMRPGPIIITQESIFCFTWDGYFFIVHVPVCVCVYVLCTYCIAVYWTNDDWCVCVWFLFPAVRWRRQKLHW